jgi:protein-S-isoprenylcysteine O-methyltransferase Ste14
VPGWPCAAFSGRSFSRASLPGIFPGLSLGFDLWSLTFAVRDTWPGCFLLAWGLRFWRSAFSNSPAPAAEPWRRWIRHVLVVRGLYRYVRNPMYLSVTTIVLGEALLAGSPALLVYWAIWFFAANLFVIGYEEPTLRRRFGQSYDLYTQEVRRWIPTFKSRN